jgi:hypothetical protein
MQTRLATFAHQRERESQRMGILTVPQAGNWQHNTAKTPNNWIAVTKTLEITA